MIKDGRQWATSLAEIRRDHVERYKWAATKVRGLVADLGCGIGYGANLLVNATGCIVNAYDYSSDALAFAKKHWDHNDIQWIKMDLEADATELHKRRFTWAIALEIIEHLHTARQFLTEIHADRLLCSVPNEAVMPFDPKRHSYHHRHYTKAEFGKLLEECGWTVEGWYTQKGKMSPVMPGDDGMTLIAECRR